MEERVGVADMILLDDITEDAILENIKERLNKGLIYVRL